MTLRWSKPDSNQWYRGTEKLPSAAPVSGPTLPRMPERGIMTSQPPGMRGMSAKSEKGALLWPTSWSSPFRPKRRRKKSAASFSTYRKDYLIELSDAVIAVKQPNGGVKLNQLFHPTATGAVSGTFWGTLIGLIFLMPLAGAAIGAAAGALSGALTDVGINDQFMKDVSQSLQSGNAALFLLIRKVTADKVLAGLQGVGGTVLRTSLDHTKEEALQRALAGAVAAQPAAVPVSTPTTAG